MFEEGNRNANVGAHAQQSRIFRDGTISVNGSDLYKTHRAQARWSRGGAYLHPYPRSRKPNRFSALHNEDIP